MPLMLTLLTIACAWAWIASERAGARANNQARLCVFAYRDARLAGLSVAAALDYSVSFDNV